MSSSVFAYSRRIALVVSGLGGDLSEVPSEDGIEYFLVVEAPVLGLLLGVWVGLDIPVAYLSV